jgi:sodium/potassium/calcium exchanger 6
MHPLCLQAGATLLAFGNGSPDVFSTFSAFRANSGSLAIGELLGAASFIVAVVSGSMSLIKPFRVPRHSFLRDVGFFTIAIAFTLVILWDEHIHGWEAATMVALYAVYVTYVAVGSWWLGRRERRRERLRKVRDEYADEVLDENVDPGKACPSPLLIN